MTNIEAAIISVENLSPIDFNENLWPDSREQDRLASQCKLVCATLRSYMRQDKPDVDGSAVDPQLVTVEDAVAWYHEFSAAPGDRSLTESEMVEAFNYMSILAGAFIDGL